MEGWRSESNDRVGIVVRQPRTRLERTLADIWTQLLPVDQVGMQDNFFELGGHSLLATRVISKIYELLHVELPIKALFEAQTVGQLSAYLEREVNAQAHHDAHWMSRLEEKCRQEIEGMSDAEVLAELGHLEYEFSHVVP